MSHKLSLVIATKDRPADLRCLLESVQVQTVKASEILIVDGGSEPVDSMVREFPGLPLRYLRHLPASTAAQRNVGIRASDPSATLLGFADDDTTFESMAFERMLNFWDTAEPDVLGAAFNIRNYPRRGSSLLKRGRLAEWLGLYSPRPGSVSRSGWQTVSGEFEKTQYVEWLPSTAVIFRRQVLMANPVDEVFESYSYLEDLDLSYSISRIGRLAVVADAGFSHFPSQQSRISARQFGRDEVLNRIYFVKKHKLSVWRCWLGIGIRAAMSVGDSLRSANLAQMSRALGNLEASLMRFFWMPEIGARKRESK